MASHNELPYEQMICTVSPNHSTFCKDGDPGKKGLTGASFFVVIDEEGSEWLLKEPVGGDIFEAADAVFDRVWRDGIREVYAANIARYIGYPTALTKLVVATIEELNVHDRPFVAYGYLPNARDVKRNMPEEFFTGVAEVENTYDIDFRPILNWLLGSHTDNGRQGVVSGIEEKKYYSIDMTVFEDAYIGYSHSRNTEPIHAGRSDIYRSVIDAGTCNNEVHKRLGICPTKFIDERNQQQVQDYFNKISELRKPEMVMSLLVPVSDLSVGIANAVSERADAITFLYERHCFQV